MAPDRLRDLLQLARPGWRRKDVEAIEARLSRVGITTVSELQAAVLSKTLNQTLHRSQQKPFPAVTLRALTAVAEGLTESTGEMPRPDREGSKEEFPRLHGLSHVSRSPRWTFSLSSGENMRRLQPPGPGSYDPYIDASPDFASRHSKGPIFSFGLSSRDGMGKPKIPGPGAYELAKEAGSSASKWTITPRREKPGASAAGTAGAGTGTASAATTGGAAAPAAPVTGFGETPGPGDYEIEALLGKKSPKYSAGKKFDSGEAEKCPGPGDYWQNDMVGSKTPSWRFGTSGRPDNVSTGQLATPGPGAYMVASTVGQAPCATLKGRHAGSRPAPLPGPGAHGGHYSSFG